MGSTNCAVVNYFKNSKKLKYFKEAPCEMYTGLLKNDCVCFLVSKENLKKRKALDKKF